MQLRSSGQQHGQPIRPIGAALGSLDPTADLAVVRLVLSHSPGAEQDLVERLACLPAMIRVKHRHMGSPLRTHELEDVVQSVLLALWRKLGQYDGRVPILFWACGFGVVEIRKAIERRSRRTEVRIEDAAEPLAAADACPVDGEQLLHALRTVGQPDRDIVVAKHFDGLTFEAIAARTGLHANTVKTKYYRALERLRAWLRGARKREEGR